MSTVMMMRLASGGELHCQVETFVQLGKLSPFSSSSTIYADSTARPVTPSRNGYVLVFTVTAEHSIAFRSESSKCSESARPGDNPGRLREL